MIVQELFLWMQLCELFAWIETYVPKRIRQIDAYSNTMAASATAEEEKQLDAAIAASVADEKNKQKLQQALEEQDHAAATLIQKRQRGNISRHNTGIMKETLAKEKASAAKTKGVAKEKTTEKEGVTKKKRK